MTAINNLSTFYLVGVIEQYRGFLEVLKLSLDPTVKHPEVWESAVVTKSNG